VYRSVLGPDAELRPLEAWHAEEFADHLDRAREHIRPWVGPAFVTETIDGAYATLRRYADSAAQDSRRIHGIWLGGQLVGGVMFVEFDARTGICELGCWLQPDAEGRGLVTTASKSLLAWAFDERQMHRVEWRCRADNERSAAVARRLGMTLDGVLRSAWLNGGEYHDKQVWSILADEWPSLQRAKK
jgi:ribosomal-protein-serine acetyltransferase